MINFDGLDIGGDTIRQNHFGHDVTFYAPSAQKPKFKLLPIQDLDEYKKGGKIRRRKNTGLRQKQKQSTNIKINIGGNSKEQPQAPRVITQYVGGSQPLNLSELISKMNAIETKVSNQQPLSFMNDVLKEQFIDTLTNRLSNLPRKDIRSAHAQASAKEVSSEEKNEKEAEEVPIGSTSGSGAAGAASSSSSGSGSSSSSGSTGEEDKGFEDEKMIPTGVTWEGMKIYTTPQGSLKYVKDEAGVITTGYVVTYARSKERKAKLKDLYHDLDEKEIKYKILTPKVL